MNRIERLRDYCREQNVDAFMVRDTSNIAYLTGFEGVFDEERAHALLVNQDHTVLHTDSRYAGACKAAAKDSPIHIDDTAALHHKWLADHMIADMNVGALGIEDSIALSEYRKLEEALTNVQLVETTDVVRTLRSVKDKREIERLQAAQDITDAAFSYIASWAKPGVTEREVQRELDNYMLTHGASGLAFPTIIASGPNGANPHAQPTDARLEAGQCVVMDFGARRAGYCSDMTRMLFVGQPSSRLKDAYLALREANEQVQATLQPGVTGAEAHQQALDILEAAGFGGLMGHGLGHGVGIDIHELPVLSPRNSEPLVEGNVVTVEPGIYIDGEFGMRLEDFGVLVPNGFHTFTRSTHDFVII